MKNVLKGFYSPLTPAEGGNELWIAQVIYGPIFLVMATSWAVLVWCPCLGLCYSSLLPEPFTPIFSESEWVNYSRQIGMCWMAYLHWKLILHSKWKTHRQLTHRKKHRMTSVMFEIRSLTKFKSFFALDVYNVIWTQ